MNQNNNDDLLFYCSKCLSIKIVDDKKGVMVCGNCGAGPRHIDITTFERWDLLYRKKYGRPFLYIQSQYDDLEEAYNEDCEEIMTASEALTNGMKVRDVINIKWDE